MKVYLFALALCGLTSAAPQNWPYRDSLMPYHRYGYPSPSQYKYLPQIEDDEDVGPYLSPNVGRQDVVVGSDGDRARPTPDPAAPGVVETGSVAPVVEPTKAPLPVQPTRAPAPPPRPIGPDGGNRPVQPPVFPPARPPPTPAPVEKDEDEEEDDESDEDDVPDADDEPDQEEGDDEGHSPDDDDNEEEEEERRRQVPLNSDETVEVAQVPVPADKVKPAVVAPAAAVPAPVVVNPAPKPVVTETSVEEVNATQVVESNEVKPDSDDDSSEEQGLGDGVEALVPGYVTDQGEVLVPVDTVSGDQPISIVPDPYSPPARGIPVRGGSHNFQSHYDDIGYSNPYYYSDDIYEGLARQDESEEVEENTENTDDEDNSNEKEDDESPEGRNEFLTDFPPARTPELYALINRRFGPQGYVAQKYSGPYGPQQRYSGPYAPQQYEPVIYRVRQQENPSVSLAIRVNGGNNGANNFYNPYLNRFPQQQQQQYVDDSVAGGQYEPQPVLRGPYSPYRPSNRPSGYNGYNGYPFVGYNPRPQYVPHPGYGGPKPVYGGPKPYGFGPRPVPIYTGQGPVYGGPRPIRPVYRPSYAYSDDGPVFIKRRPIAASIRPVKQPIAQITQFSLVRTKNNPVKAKRPTPVDYQDDEPYPFQNPFLPVNYSVVDHVETSASDSSSVEEPKKVVQPSATPVVAPKSRRAAKMAKKTNKKNLEKKKKLTDPDPLNILKKINVKRP